MNTQKGIELVESLPGRVVGWVLNLEVAYEDFSQSQQTPSRLEEVTFATEELCKAGQAAVGQWLAAHPDVRRFVFWYPGSEPVLVAPSGLCYDPPIAVGVLKEMYEEEYGRVR